VKYSACAECEIIHFVNCEISHFVRCEMKFAHVRISEHFTFAKQIFHSEAISLAQRANFVEKSTSATQMCFFLSNQDEKTVKPVFRLRQKFARFPLASEDPDGFTSKPNQNLCA